MNEPDALATAADPLPEQAVTVGLAPVVMFAYSRPDHLRHAVESLLQNPECERTHIHFFCDGPKRPDVQGQVDAVRRYVDSVRGFASVTRVYREQNLGLAESVIDGVTRVVGQHGRLIVLEDDLILSQHFLRFMNAALDRYQSDAQVASIHGYCYPTRVPLPDTFFIKGADCWGWATWQRAWQHFEPNGQLLLDQLRSRGLSGRFDYGGRFPFTQMLQDQVAGRNSSWAIRWHASCFLKDMLTLYPGRSLVHNSGFDSSGRHCDSLSDFDQQVSDSPVAVGRIPAEESSTAWRAFQDFFDGLRPPLHQRAWVGLKRRLAGAVPSRLRRRST
jgi:hypothetical protein